MREQAHTNGIESFWAMLKRGYEGTYHKMSVKHLGRYVGEFSGRHNDRSSDTIDQMRHMVQECRWEASSVSRSHVASESLRTGLQRKRCVLVKYDEAPVGLEPTFNPPPLKECCFNPIELRGRRTERGLTSCAGTHLFIYKS